MAFGTTALLRWRCILKCCKQYSIQLLSRSMNVWQAHRIQRLKLRCTLEATLRFRTIHTQKRAFGKWRSERGCRIHTIKGFFAGWQKHTVYERSYSPHELPAAALQLHYNQFSLHHCIHGFHAGDLIKWDACSTINKNSLGSPAFATCGELRLRVTPWQSDTISKTVHADLQLNGHVCNTTITFPLPAISVYHQPLRMYAALRHTRLRTLATLENFSPKPDNSFSYGNIRH